MSRTFLKVRNGIVLNPQSADPADGVTGAVYFNSTSSSYRAYLNGAWQDISVAAVHSTDSTSGNIVSLATAGKSSVRLTGTLPVIQGIGDYTNAKEILIFAVGDTVTLKHEDLTAAAAERLALPSETDMTITKNTGLFLKYDDVSGRWRAIGGGGGGGGEVNTASNLGTGADGEGVYSTKVGVDLRFKRIKQGTGITVTSETNDLLVSTTAEANTASNLGTGSDGEGLFDSKSGVDLRFKRIKAGSGVTLTPETNDVVISAPGAGVAAADIAPVLNQISLVNLPLISLPTTGAPVAGYTTVVNRAKMPDPSNDLALRGPVERLICQQIFRLPNEQGPSGQSVWGIVGDKFSQIRLVGDWFSGNDSGGQYVQATNLNSDFVEITFYGTGLNLLGFQNSSNRNWTYYVDGSGPTSGSYPTSSPSGTTASRGYSQNCVFPVASGLSLGLHTVKIINGSSAVIPIHGFEILGDFSNLKVQPGTYYVNAKALTLGSQSSFAWNTSFESGTLGTKGGCVLVYQKSDGSIAKALTPTDTGTPLYGTNADHSNEEVTREYHWREFGCGRSDDFSTLTGSGFTARAFALSDATTSLIGNACQAVAEGIDLNTTGDTFIFTFIGTGLDIFTLNNTVPKWEKIASGLSYGTHTFKWTWDGSAYDLYIDGSIVLSNYSTGGLRLQKFRVWAPKKPSLPSGAAEIGQYYLTGNAAANTTAGLDTIATGVIRKAGLQEVSYVGSWNSPGLYPVDRVGGWEIDTSSNGSYFELTFEGTGFEIRGRTASSYQTAVPILVDGSVPTGATVTSYGGFSHSYTSGVTLTVNMNNASVNAGSGISVMGLPFGKHTLRLTAQSGGNSLVFDVIDVFTPVHFPKMNQYAEVQNSMNVGSCSIGDLRQLGLSDSKEPRIAKLDLPDTISTSSSSLVPMYGFAIPFMGKNKKVKITYSIPSYNNAGGGGYTAFAIFVDVQQVSTPKTMQYTYWQTVTDSVTVHLSEGIHFIQVFWRCNTPTAYASVISGYMQPTLQVEEL